MAKINLRDFYPNYTEDYFVDVPDELAEQMRQWERDERAQRRKKYWHHAHYSLDCGDGIERQALFVADSMEEHYEKTLTTGQLHAALSNLPAMQAKRIYACYVLGLSKAEIARREGKSVNTIKDSILNGLINLQKYLEKNS